MEDFAGKKIWITGASTGLGRQLALDLLDRGSDLIVTSRRQQGLESIKSIAPERVTVLAADLAEEGIENYLASQLASIGSALDMVILNAGTCEYVDVENMQVDMFQRVNDVNYIGAIRCVTASLPLLKNTPGSRIVGVSSAAAFTGLTRSEAYGSSKAALRHFLQALRVDLYSSGIDVCIVYPGFVDTPLTQKNDFPMPFIMSAEEASSIILNELEKRKLEIAFPWKLIYGLKLLGILPAKLRTKISQKMTREH